MSGNFHTSGYTEDTNQIINRKIKSTLRKIHKLKRENLVLSQRRTATFNSLITLKVRGDLGSVKLTISTIKIMEISERIGKNGNKIQRLRTKISQLKKSLALTVDE